MKYTTTVVDYLRWRGDIPFSADPFNEVDNLVLCIVSYLNFRRFPELLTRNPKEAVLLRDISQKLTEEDEQLGLSQLAYIPVVQQAAQTERFADVRMFAFEDRSDEEAQMQFAAVSFLLPDKSVFIAFRGTDTTLVGWKEDFNMSFLESVPAQVRAAEYAAEILKLCRFHRIRIGGHSKGGNLAAWAGLHLPRRAYDRLLAVYNNDGPGFFDNSPYRTKQYKELLSRYNHFIPSSSFVGVLLAFDKDYTVVKSKRILGPTQHDLSTWQITDCDLKTLPRPSKLAKINELCLSGIMYRINREQGQNFDRVATAVIEGSGQVNLLGVSKHLPSVVKSTVKTWKSLDEDTRKEFRETFSGSKEILKDSVKLVVTEGNKEAREEALEDLALQGVKLEALKI